MKNIVLLSIRKFFQNKSAIYAHGIKKIFQPLAYSPFQFLKKVLPRIGLASDISVVTIVCF